MNAVIDYFDYFNNGMHCPYNYPVIYGGCPPECPFKADCPCYDGDDLKITDNIE